jgi:DNA-binding HxlR family transcriptional regulator
VVSLEDIPFLPSLRGLLRAKSSPQWNELKQILWHSIAAKFADKRKISLLAWIQYWGSRRSAQPPALFQMMAGYWVSQSIYVASKLGIPDAIQSGPKSCREIAAITGVHENSLFRLLRVLESIGICTRKKERYELTAQGRLLQSNVQGSLRSMALTLGEIHYEAWGNLDHSIRTGQPAFNDVFGTGLFQHLSKNRVDGATFNAAMTDFSGLVSYAVALAYDFSGIQSIVDVGGGHGKFLQTILGMNAYIQGIVFDLPAVIQGTQEHLASMGERCVAVAGDFFNSVPCGAGVYILSGVIHDWHDAQSITILQNCRNAMVESSRILVVEMIVPEAEPCFSTLLDLNMLVMSGGRERTESEFRSLFQSAKLEVTRIISTLSPLKIVEARRA